MRGALGGYNLWALSFFPNRPVAPVAPVAPVTQNARDGLSKSPVGCHDSHDPLKAWAGKSSRIHARRRHHRHIDQCRWLDCSTQLTKPFSRAPCPITIHFSPQTTTRHGAFARQPKREESLTPPSHPNHFPSSSRGPIHRLSFAYFNSFPTSHANECRLGLCHLEWRKSPRYHQNCDRPSTDDDHFAEDLARVPETPMQVILNRNIYHLTLWELY